MDCFPHLMDLEELLLVSVYYESVTILGLSQSPLIPSERSSSTLHIVPPDFSDFEINAS
jgi:hypothetical protein